MSDGAVEDTVRGLSKMSGCLAGTVGVIALIAVCGWLIISAIGLIFDFVFNVIPDLWEEYWKWIVFPILGFIVLKIAREIGRQG